MNKKIVDQLSLLKVDFDLLFDLLQEVVGEVKLPKYSEFKLNERMKQRPFNPDNVSYTLDGEPVFDFLLTDVVEELNDILADEESKNFGNDKQRDDSENFKIILTEIIENFEDFFEQYNASMETLENAIEGLENLENI